MELSHYSKLSAHTKEACKEEMGDTNMLLQFQLHAGHLPGLIQHAIILLQQEFLDTSLI